MIISSRTPEGRPNRCPVCGSEVVIEPPDPPGDAACPTCGHLIWFDQQKRGDEQVIQLTETRIQPESLDAAFEAAATMPGTRFVVDFSEVRDVSSAGLARLVSLKKQANITRRRLVFRHLRPDVLDVFRITRLDQVFEIEP